MNLAQLDTSIRTLTLKLLMNVVPHTEQELMLVLTNAGHWARMAAAIDQAYPDAASTALQDIRTLCGVYQQARAAPGTLLTNAPLVAQTLAEFEGRARGTADAPDAKPSKRKAATPADPFEASSTGG